MWQKLLASALGAQGMRQGSKVLYFQCAKFTAHKPKMQESMKHIKNSWAFAKVSY